MKVAGKIFTVLFYIFLLFIFYNIVDLYFFHKDQDFINFEHSKLTSKGNASEDIRKEIFFALHISENGKPLSDPEKMDLFVETHYSGEDILLLGTSSEEMIVGFNEVKRFKHGDLDFLKNVRFETEKAYISTRDNAAWLSIVGYFQTVIDGLILPLRHHAVLIKHDNVWKIHMSQTDWFYDTNFLINKIIFSVIFTIICFIILLIRIILSTISLIIQKRELRISTPGIV